MVKYKIDFQIIWIPKSNANIFKNTILVKKKKKKKATKTQFCPYSFQSKLKENKLQKFCL